MMLVPTKPLAAQTFDVVLANQNTTLNIYQKSTGLFMDVSVNNALIIAGVICENWNVIVRSAYLGFIGDFAWWDTEGKSDPLYTGLGSQFQLWYLEAADLPAGLA